MTGGLGSWRTSGDNPNGSIIENDRNSKRRLEGTCCHSDSSKKPSANTDVKSSNERIIIIIIGQVETIQTTAFLRMVSILKRVLLTSGDLLSLRLKWKTIS